MQKAVVVAGFDGFGFFGIALSLTYNHLGVVLRFSGWFRNIAIVLSVCKEISEVLMVPIVFNIALSLH